MAEDRTQRRLAAILAADVVGYSRLIELDEGGTLVALRERRREILNPLVAAHHGRVAKVMGDGVLVEFGSAVNAVACAVELQKRMAAANERVTEDRRITLRIGINLGDVVVDGGDLYGDSVNIAARLEGLAEPGDICISLKVHDEVCRKLKLVFDDWGEQQFKNIATPVRAYRVAAEREQASVPDDMLESVKLSIAVLPFTNLSGDPAQEYFSDGITEDIITELSRFRNLFVVAGNSSFTLKGRAVDVKEVGRKLGARYVVEGSVQKGGNRVRITAQLVEATTGTHLWAERYDRDLADIFAVQDEVVRTISGTIPGHLNRAAVENLRRKPPKNLTAYDCELRGRMALAHWSEGLSVALKWFEQAIRADPEYALAHAGIAMAYSYGLYVLGLPPDTALTRAKEHAQRAIALDDMNPTVNAYAAFTYHNAGEHKLARTYAERAVSFNPNDPFVLYIQASTLCYAGGEPKQALEWLRKSEGIEPYTPDDYRLDTLQDCYYTLCDYGKVIEIHEVHQLPAYLKLVLAAAFAQIGQIEKAKAAIEGYEWARPPAHDATTMIKYQMRMFSRQEIRDHWLEGYRKAGINV